MNVRKVISYLAMGISWSCFFFYNRWEAKKMNARLKELDTAEKPEP